MHLTLSALETRLTQNARRTRQPVTCLFELTPVCNLRCGFCYVALDPYRGPYLTTAQIELVLGKLERAGVLWLTLTGGEILSRRDFPAIYRAAKKKGFLVTLYTNATMVNEATAELLRELPPLSVEVSIYGADAQHYERTTGIPGSFARFERGVRLLQEAGVSLLLKHPVNRVSEDHLDAISAWCTERGIPHKFDLALDLRHDGGEQPALFRIEPRSAKRAAGQISSLRARLEEPERFGPLPECTSAGAQPGTAELYTCLAGRTAFFVDALGNMSHCVMDRTPTFSLLELEFDEIWMRIGEWVTQSLPASAPCSGCSLRSTCSNCPARARLATGSPYLKDPYYCDVTHARHGLPPLRHPDYRASVRELGACAV